MPLITMVIDDKSPLIEYDNTWLAGTSNGPDPLASDYFLGTFTVNSVTGSATFTFNGSAIWVYGAKRTNHGGYTIQVDGKTYGNYNGNANNLFQQSLFNTSGLSQGTHTLTLTNSPTSSQDNYVDIDMIVWQSEVGATGDQLITEIVQDTDPRFTYQEAAWSTNPSPFNFNLFSNGTGHATETYSASVTFAFTGTVVYHITCEAVTVFGTTGSDNGPYSVQLDGSQATTYNATNDDHIIYDVALYHADNLGPGSHQIVLTNLPGQPGQGLSIDYARLWTLVNTTASGNGSVPGSFTASSSQNHLSSGALAGIVVASIVAALAAGVAVFFYTRWRAALSAQSGPLRFYTSLHQPPVTATSTVAATGVSSSLDTRSHRVLLSNGTSSQIHSSGRAEQSEHFSASYDEAALLSTIRGSINSSAMVSVPSQSLGDEGTLRRALPEAPGGGLSLTAEFQKPPALGMRRQSIGQSSVAMSEVPPDYNQAIENPTNVAHT